MRNALAKLLRASLTLAALAFMVPASAADAPTAAPSDDGELSIDFPVNEKTTRHQIQTG